LSWAAGQWPTLRRLRFTFFPRVMSDEGLVAVADSLPGLRSLEVCEDGQVCLGMNFPRLYPGFTSQAVQQLSTLRELQWAQLCCVRNMTQERKNQMRLAFQPTHKIWPTVLGPVVQIEAVDPNKERFNHLTPDSFISV